MQPTMRARFGPAATFAAIRDLEPIGRSGPVTVGNPARGALLG